MWPHGQRGAATRQSQAAFPESRRTCRRARPSSLSPARHYACCCMPSSSTTTAPRKAPASLFSSSPTPWRGTFWGCTRRHSAGRKMNLAKRVSSNGNGAEASRESTACRLNSPSPATGNAGRKNRGQVTPLRLVAVTPLRLVGTKKRPKTRKAVTPLRLVLTQKQSPHCDTLKILPGVQPFLNTPQRALKEGAPL